jgi:hypothetical protein
LLSSRIQGSSWYKGGGVTSAMCRFLSSCHSMSWSSITAVRLSVFPALVTTWQGRDGRGANWELRCFRIDQKLLFHEGRQARDTSPLQVQESPAAHMPLKSHCVGVLERCTHVILEGVVVLEVDQIVEHGVIGPLMNDGGDLHREGGEQLRGWWGRALPASTAPQSTADLIPDSTFLPPPTLEVSQSIRWRHREQFQ